MQENNRRRICHRGKFINTAQALALLGLSSEANYSQQGLQEEINKLSSRVGQMVSS